MKKLSLVLAVLLTAVLLTGCPRLVRIEDYRGSSSVASVDESQEISEPAPTRPSMLPSDSSSETDSSSSEPTTAADVTRWRNNQRGSAVLLEGKTLLISLYISDPSIDCLGDNEILTTRRYLEVAAEYLESVGEEYGVKTELVWNEEDLVYRAELDHRLVGADDDQVSRMLTEWIDDHIDTDDLLLRYGADGIGFLLFVNDGDVSYTMPFYVGDESVWFYEYCELFYMDEYDYGCEPPSVYAHEILHLFGAPDLYESNEGDGVSEELVQYVEQNLPQELMYNTYDENGYSVFNRVDQYVSPLTAYRLGLLDGEDSSVSELLERFPEFVCSDPGCFVYSTRMW